MHHITIFTPTYNRAELLPRLFESLQAQTLSVFEWIIVDDGSNDATQEVVQDFTKRADFPIRYIRQENRGKHFAINKGVQEANGDYFFIVDSDDMLPTDALELIESRITTIDHRPEIGGISGRCQYLNGEMIGCFEGDLIEANALDIRFKHRVKGDLSEVFRTAVLREFPFPEIEGEKFCPEALVWNRIAQKYALAYFNQPIYIAEYQPEGLSSNIVTIRMYSPLASLLTYSEMASYDIPWKEKIKVSINFWRFAFHSDYNLSQKFEMLNTLWSLAVLPLGYFLYLLDKNKHLKYR